MLTHAGALVLPAVPLLVLLGCLLLGRFPGERTIARVSRRLSRPGTRPSRRVASPRPCSPAMVRTPRGSLLIAAGIARRPPPALA